MIREEAGSDKAQDKGQARLNRDADFCRIVLTSDKWLELRQALMVPESRGFG